MTRSRAWSIIGSPWRNGNTKRLSSSSFELKPTSRPNDLRAGSSISLPPGPPDFTPSTSCLPSSPACLGKSATQTNGNYCPMVSSPTQPRVSEVHAGGGINAERGVIVGKLSTSERFAQAMIAQAVGLHCERDLQHCRSESMVLDSFQSSATVPANSHFITDVDLSYLCCGITLCSGVLYPSGRLL